MITSLSTNESLSVVDSIGLVSANDNTTTGLNWISEWVGYIALCMFSLVFVIPTLGIVGLIIWEYFSDEAERKAERKKEIDKAILKMNQHFSSNSGNPLETKLKNRLRQTKTQSDKIMEDILSMNDLIDNNTSTLDEIDDEYDEYEDEEGDSPDLNDVDDVLKQADSILHKRIRKGDSHTKSAESINFDEILT